MLTHKLHVHTKRLYP